MVYRSGALRTRLFERKLSMKGLAGRFDRNVLIEGLGFALRSRG